MDDKIIPELNHLQIFGDGTFKDSDKPSHIEGREWLVEGEFTVLDRKTLAYNQSKPFYKKRQGNKDGDLGYVYPFIACSPGFLKAHPEQFQNLKFNPIIMEVYSKEQIRKYLEGSINKLGAVTYGQLNEQLSKFADVDYDQLPKTAT